MVAQNHFVKVKALSPSVFQTFSKNLPSQSIVITFVSGPYQKLILKPMRSIFLKDTWYLQCVFHNILFN